MEKREPQTNRPAAAQNRPADTAVLNRPAATPNGPAAAQNRSAGTAAPGPAAAAPKRPADSRIRMVAGLCPGPGMYGVIHALRTEEGALRLTAAAVTLACGLLPALRIRKRTPRKNR